MSVSRMLRDNLVTVPTAETQVQLGDIYRAVGPRTHVQRVVSAMGRRSDKNLGEISGVKGVPIVHSAQVMRANALL